MRFLATKWLKNDQFYAFLDINPLTKGHTLVVPKCEVDYIFDLEDNELAAMHVFAKSVALAIQKVFPCKKVGEAVIGLEVPHAHIHLIPIQKESDMIFSNSEVETEQMKNLWRWRQQSIKPGKVVTSNLFLS